MKIALCQMLSTQDVERNIATIREYTALAAARGARLVVFPEAAMRCFGGSLYDAAAQHEFTFRSALAEIAREHYLTLVAGGFAPVELSDEWDLRVYNNLYAYDQTGTETIYTKVHLYDAFGFKESDGVKAGESLRTITVDGTVIGLATCYDLRFPKLFTEYARAGAQATVVAASWAGGEGKVAQWQVLTTARALDSTQFVLAVDQASPASADARADVTQPRGVGYSRAVDPLGLTLVEAGEAPEILVVDLDLSRVADARQSIPVLTNAKLGY
ncbi:nitrilase-related carbon-nitrogen hydrolase [Rothia sp. P5766]|uniref:nitrilase-related carbon-nitrogen hydrolase n=1 Tax=unclassified Rothia (in: high G+C Gram-positive bacteria) TaxID=2689056 RepID=UPI003AD09A67